MAVLVAAFGLLIAALGLLGAARPTGLIELLRRAWSTRRGLYLAAGFRVLFGIVLLLAASESAYRVALASLGGLAIATALIGLLMGYQRDLAFIEWWSQRPASFIRVWSLAAIAFGVFLVISVA